MEAGTPGVPPVVCTLTMRELASQRLEWADLVPLATSCQEIDGGALSTYALTLADQIEELAGRELLCCGSWLTITYERATDEFRLHLTTTNPGGVDLIRSMSGLAAD